LFEETCICKRFFTSFRMTNSMKLKPNYNFREAELGPKFARDKLKEFRELIDASLSFVVLSMPGVGVSYFLRYLAMQTFAAFVHVDLYLLPTLSRHEFYKLLLTELNGTPDKKTEEELLEEIKKNLKSLTEKRTKIVIIFSRFDTLKDQFNWNFLSNIQSLATSFPEKVVLIFTSTKPLFEIVDAEAMSGGNLHFYSENLYFKPYSGDDLKKLCTIEPIRPGLPKPVLEELLKLSGGHNQLLHILLNSQKPKNLVLDKFVKLQMKELVDYLDYSQRKTIQNIALGKAVIEVDDYLLGVGMVENSKIKNQKSKFTLFTPLLSEYIKTNAPVKLPAKESKLFKLLRKNIGKTVSKDEIFTEVWPARNAPRSEAGGGEIDENATDWALDALIYRLRKHPFMQKGGFIIESQKKVGYTLIQT